VNVPILNKVQVRSIRSSLCAGSLVTIVLVKGCVAAVGQQPATVSQILAGTMLPGDEVATFEHSETLYPFSRVPRKGPVLQLALLQTDGMFLVT
jgi:hypothetical protein